MVLLSTLHVTTEQLNMCYISNGEAHLLPIWNGNTYTFRNVPQLMPLATMDAFLQLQFI